MLFRSGEPFHSGLEFKNCLCKSFQPLVLTLVERKLHKVEDGIGKSCYVAARCNRKSSGLEQDESRFECSGLRRVGIAERHTDFCVSAGDHLIVAVPPLSFPPTTNAVDRPQLGQDRPLGLRMPLTMYTFWQTGHVNAALLPSQSSDAPRWSRSSTLHSLAVGSEGNSASSNQGNGVPGTGAKTMSLAERDPWISGTRNMWQIGRASCWVTV